MTPPDRPTPKFVAGDRVEVNVPVYARGRVVGEPRWSHLAHQWKYDVRFDVGGMVHSWTENRLDAIAEVE